MKCLLLTLPDNREILTYENNYEKILDFAQSLGIKISRVEAISSSILDLKETAKVICDQNYPYKAFYNKTSLRDYMENVLRSGGVINIKEIHNNFEVPNSTIYNHLYYLKKKLKIKKVGVGLYGVI